ncbi:cupin domain-containing protein [Acrocarpospora macrocephala]|uniref:MerR family transcriptional regulator n=1 Tax=Acrocarpospora macrocephala TaxID=150177 RepID=A0A5M3WQL4_9ACTN|nr:XRE family transcriptional regulator [Acrocarpospora macrocephala]GES11184.1 MerR family transcriptional regulator [Acrocarpospora macrocephala]
MKQGDDGLDAVALGGLIRERRQAQRMSLSQLAERAGVSTSFVSQVERGVANPTLSSLKSLVSALGFSVGELLENAVPKTAGQQHTTADDEVAVLRAGERRRIVYPGTQIANELLSPNLQKSMEIIWVEAAPGQGSGGHPHVHEGEECGVVISGAMKFAVGSNEWVLNPRDAIYFPSTRPHSWESVGDEDLVAIWVITPPTF